jgi:hypothetical protein
MAVGSASRSDGIYVTGCVVSPSKRACLFQMMDGTSMIHSVGGAIQKDMKILSISEDGVKVSSPGGAKTVKVGEQIK